MRVWTNSSFRTLDLLSGPEPTVDSLPVEIDVRSALERVVASEAALSMTRLAVGHRRLAMTAHVVALRATALIIGRPTYRPGQRALAAGEVLEMRVAIDEASCTGRTTVLARYAPEGEDARKVTYALAVPSVLLLDDRRNKDRLGLAFAEPPRAELLCAPRHKPLGHGSIIDLSSGGMRLRLSDANVRAGDRIVLRAKLNDEILVHAMGTVVHAGPRLDGRYDVGIRFQAEQPDIQRFIRGVSVTSPSLPAT